PWPIPNHCGFSFDPSTYSVNGTNAFVGQSFTCTRIPPSTAPTAPTAPLPTPVPLYEIDIPITPPTARCPSTNAVSCSTLFTGGPHADYRENIACNGMLSITSTDQI